MSQIVFSTVVSSPVREPEQTYYAEADLRHDFDLFMEAKQQIQSYLAYLRSLPDAALIEQANRGIDTRCPPPEWLDYREYAGLRYWSLDQAVALSLNTDPAQLNWRQLECWPNCSPVAYHYRNRRELFLRAVAIGELSDPISPGMFALWAQRTGLRIPDAMQEATAEAVSFYAPLEELVLTRSRRFSGRAATTRPNPKNKPPDVERDVPNTRAYNTLSKLVLGMAIGGYGYDPSASRSDVVTIISDDLAKHSEPVDPDTIRKKLREAADQYWSRETQDGDAQS